MSRKKNPSVLILAAGTSGRMGRLKAFLPFDQHRCFLEKIIDEYFDFGISELIVVLNDNGMRTFEKMNFKKKPAVKAVLNAYPEKERFFSVQTGLAALSALDAVFLHNVDNPFINKEVLHKLLKHIAPETYVVPVFDNSGGHPVLLSKEIVSNLISVSDYTLNLKTLLHRYATTRIPVDDEMILVNINTPEDYEYYVKRGMIKNQLNDG